MKPGDMIVIKDHSHEVLVTYEFASRHGNIVRMHWSNIFFCRNNIALLVTTWNEGNEFWCLLAWSNSQKAFCMGCVRLSDLSIV